MKNSELFANKKTKRCCYTQSQTASLHRESTRQANTRRVYTQQAYTESQHDKPTRGECIHSKPTQRVNVKPTPENVHNDTAALSSSKHRQSECQTPVPTDRAGEQIP